MVNLEEVPNNIQDKADDIRTKIYGEEVREALASGLDGVGHTLYEA